MKNLKLLLTMAIALFFFSLQAQELSRSVFASSGETTANGNLKLSWTIGQSGLVGSFTQNPLTLNVGFQQFDDLGTFIVKTNQLSSLRVFPNPFQDAFYLNLELESKGQVDYYIYDNVGKLVLQKNNSMVMDGYFEEKVSIQNQPSGMYNLTIFFFPENNSPTQSSIKLIKQ